jgi:hypothetical protein
MTIRLISLIAQRKRNGILLLIELTFFLFLLLLFFFDVFGTPAAGAHRMTRSRHGNR